MHEVWGMAALWLGLALVATLLSIRPRIATALSETVVGTVAQMLLGVFLAAPLGADQPWIRAEAGLFLSAVPRHHREVVFESSS